MHHATAASALDRTLLMVRAEYREMPGLGLTLAQAARFFALTPSDSERVMRQLIDEGLVFRDLTGVYRRVTDLQSPRT
jgi:hypothetical protein